MDDDGVLFLALILVFLLTIFVFLWCCCCYVTIPDWTHRRAALQLAIQRAAAQRRHRIDASHLTIQRHIGSGQFGDVFFGYYKKQQSLNSDAASLEEQRLKVALKVAKVGDESSQSTSSHNNGLTAAYCFFQEVNALDFLVYKNIIQAIGVCTNLRLNGANRTTLALVMEYMDGGSAIDYIRKDHSRLTHIDLLTILSDISEAGQHLCAMGVVHRDIGARNVLVHTVRKYAAPSSTNAPSLIAKLTDFGLAKDVGLGLESYQSINHNILFQMRYTAPEGFTGKFSSKSDVWSFGVLAWELYASMDLMMGPASRCAGASASSANSASPAAVPTTSALVVPYSRYAKAEDIFDALCNDVRLEHSKLTPLAVRMLTNTCWMSNPNSRPGFAQLTSAIKSAMGNLRGAARMGVGLRSISERVQTTHTVMDSGTDCDRSEGVGKSFASPVDSTALPGGYASWK